ncbi:alpha/beta hydrolase [Streptomyces sp. NPDC096339]|uniref:alpha/beta hydrolase n=1 Tax=Streptomyces sp. NPDC096339 TaxID=3366086 RepID=UPI0037F1B490
MSVIHDQAPDAGGAVAATEDFFFDVGGHRLAATTVRTVGGAAPDVVHLHGLGTTATRHGVRYLLDDLAAHGHASLTFEFSGNGDSTGVMAQATLRRRKEETLAAVGLLDGERRPVLIGTSMGGHLASWAVPQLRPRALVLFCPAAYPADAADDAFGDGTRPGNHADSPAFAGIGEFDGDLLIIGARQDQVVSEATVDGYLAHATKARSRRVIWLDCDHFIHRWLPEQDAVKTEVLDALRSVVTAGTHEPADRLANEEGDTE